jgi:hypothetical protein
MPYFFLARLRFTIHNAQCVIEQFKQKLYTFCHTLQQFVSVFSSFQFFSPVYSVSLVPPVRSCPAAIAGQAFCLNLSLCKVGKYTVNMTIQITHTQQNQRIQCTIKAITII